MFPKLDPGKEVETLVRPALPLLLLQLALFMPGMPQPVEAANQSAGNGPPAGHDLRLHDIPYSHILPEAFLDQALAPNPQLYPRATILIRERFRRLDATAAYARVGYRRAPESARIVLSGVVTRDTRAWSFERAIQTESQGLGLAQTLTLVSAGLRKFPAPIRISTLPLGPLRPCLNLHRSTTGN